MQEPEGWKATWVQEPLSPVNVCRVVALRTSWTWTVLSSAHETNMRPSGENRTQRTWGRERYGVWFVMTVHTHINESLAWSDDPQLNFSFILYYENWPTGCTRAGCMLTSELWFQKYVDKLWCGESEEHLVLQNMMKYLSAFRLWPSTPTNICLVKKYMERPYNLTKVPTHAPNQQPVALPDSKAITSFATLFCTHLTLILSLALWLLNHPLYKWVLILTHV